MSAPPSEIVARRLRAHKLVPQGQPVQVVSPGDRVPRPGKLAWRAVNPVTGRDYRVGSRFGVQRVAVSRHWEIVTEGDLTLVEPGDG